MIQVFSLLLIYQLVGELIVRAFTLPIPGPVIGMALLFLTLLVRGRIGEPLRDGASTGYGLGLMSGVASRSSRARVMW